MITSMVDLSGSMANTVLEICCALLINRLLVTGLPFHSASHNTNSSPTQRMTSSKSHCCSSHNTSG